jgi:hypothetical protein
MSTPGERLRRSDAEETYVRAGELEVYRQLQRDARDVDASLRQERAIAVGPFGRVRTDAVVDALGKTRGAINNLWGSQEAFRAAIMHLFLDDTTLGLNDVEYPAPASCGDLDEWIERWAAVEIERGPRHGMEPESRYGMRWAAWLGLVPYGIWSESIAAASLHEYRAGVQHVAHAVLEPAFEQFGVVLHDASIEELATAVTSAIEGCWLNAALTPDDPVERGGTIASSLATSLRLILRGATSR